MDQVPKQEEKSGQQPHSRRDQPLEMRAQRNRELPDADSQGDHTQSRDATVDCAVACCRVFQWHRSMIF